MAYSPNQISQQDPRWKNEKLGFKNSKIGPYGCALTSLTMLVNGFGENETPASLNEKLKGLGRGNGFIDDMVVWGGLPVLFPDFSLRKVYLCREDAKPAPLAEIDAALARGQAVLVELDRSPAPGIQNHWVVLYKKVGNDYLMNDPWSYPTDEGQTKLAPRYAGGRPLKKVITAVVWYENATTAPPLADGFYVRVFANAASGLRIRSQPTTASVTLAFAPARAYLRVLDAETDARAKIGVRGEWLHVRDLDGVEGYVAAWFVDAVENNGGTGDDDDTNDNPNDPPVNDDPDETPIDDPSDDEDDEPITTPGIKVYVSKVVGERGLRLRAQPGLGGSLLTTLDAGAELTSLEDEATTHTKLNAADAWLHIQVGAHVGYTAAWLLTLDPNEELSSEPEEPAEDPHNEPTEDPNSTADDELPTQLTGTVFPSLGRNGLRMRAAPNLNGRLVGVLVGGTQLKLLGDPLFVAPKVGVYGQWLHVRTLKGKEGYVAAWYVKLNETALHIPAPDKLIVYVTPLARGGLRMRKGPATGWRIIKTLKANSALTVLENEEEAIAKIGATQQWLHVRDEAGTEGYVAAWYIVR